jgi:hypothetical protein
MKAADMPAAAINKELDALAKKRSKLNDEFIAAGRGSEKAWDTLKLNDPLANKYKALSDRVAELMSEVQLRAGPGTRRLPKGFGPRDPYGDLAERQGQAKFKKKSAGWFKKRGKMLKKVNEVLP